MREEKGLVFTRKNQIQYAHIWNGEGGGDGGGGGGGGGIVNENGRHCQTKLIQQIIISYLIN